MLIRTDRRQLNSNGKKNGLRTISVLTQMLLHPRSFIRENTTLVKFAIVGASGLAVNLVLLTVLKLWINVLFANAIAVELSVINNFTWNDMYTFKARTFSTDLPKIKRLAKYNFVSIISQVVTKIIFSPKIRRLIKYNFVSVVSLVVNQTVFSLLIFFGVWYIFASVAAVNVAFGTNYFGSSRWAWRVFPKSLLEEVELVKN